MYRAFGVLHFSIRLHVFNAYLVSISLDSISIIIISLLFSSASVVIIIKRVVGQPAQRTKRDVIRERVDVGVVVSQI